MSRGFGCRSMALGFKLRALFVLKMGLGSRCSGRYLFLVSISGRATYFRLLKSREGGLAGSRYIVPSGFRD